jgi:hypothetical protein
LGGPSLIAFGGKSLMTTMDSSVLITIRMYKSGLKLDFEMNVGICFNDVLFAATLS